MRIGIDARLWNESGVGRYIRNLVKWLEVIDRENEYVLFLREKEYGNVKCQMVSQKRNSLREPNVKFKKVLTGIHWHTVKEQLSLPKILEKEKLDLIHFPYFSVPIFYNKPYVVTIHDLTLTHFPTGKASTLPYPFYFLKYLGYRFVLNQAIKKAKKVITPTKATKKEILDHFSVPEEKIAVTYEGVDFFKTGRRLSIKNTKFQIEKGAYLLYVGNAYPHKNLERLLEAFRSLIINHQSSMRDLKLILVGREDYFYKRLKKKVREMNLSNKVIFHGEVDDPKLCWLYQNAIALVLPSLMEGFGLSALEAMACGCLVLASNIPALKEVCGEVAIYFDPNKVEKIAEALGKVIDYNSIRQLADRKKKLSRQRAKMFSWRKMAEETLRVYNSLMVSNDNRIDANTELTKAKKIVLPHLSYKIMGILFKVHNELGPSLLEKYYQRGISKELRRNKLKFKKEIPVEIRYGNESIGRYFLDFVIEGLVNFRGDRLRYKRVVNPAFENVDLTDRDLKFKPIR